MESEEDHVPNFNFVVDEDTLPSWVFSVSASYLAVIGVFGIVSNSAIIISFARNKRVR